MLKISELFCQQLQRQLSDRGGSVGGSVNGTATPGAVSSSGIGGGSGSSCGIIMPHLGSQQALVGSELCVTAGNIPGSAVSSTGGGQAGDRGSCSADSGVRGSSDRESGGATSVGGNLSDSTTDGEPPRLRRHVQAYRTILFPVHFPFKYDGPNFTPSSLLLRCADKSGGKKMHTIIASQYENCSNDFRFLHFLYSSTSSSRCALNCHAEGCNIKNTDAAMEITKIYLYTSARTSRRLSSVFFLIIFLFLFPRFIKSRVLVKGSRPIEWPSRLVERGLRKRKERPTHARVVEHDVTRLIYITSPIYFAQARRR